MLTTRGEGALLKSIRWGVAWKQGGTGAGDESVEAAGLGGRLQEGTGNCRRLGVGSNGELTLGGSWDGMLGRWQAVGNAWAGRPVACTGTMIQRYLEGW